MNEAEKDQRDEVMNSLDGFVLRVANDKEATPAEVAALAEVARAYLCFCH